MYLKYQLYSHAWAIFNNIETVYYEQVSFLGANALQSHIQRLEQSEYTLTDNSKALLGEVDFLNKHNLISFLEVTVERKKGWETHLIPKTAYLCAETGKTVEVLKNKNSPFPPKAQEHLHLRDKEDEQDNNFADAINTPEKCMTYAEKQKDSTAEIRRFADISYNGYLNPDENDEDIQAQLINQILNYRDVYKLPANDFSVSYLKELSANDLKKYLDATLLAVKDAEKNLRSDTVKRLLNLNVDFTFLENISYADLTRFIRHLDELEKNVSPLFGSKELNDLIEKYKNNKESK